MLDFFRKRNLLAKMVTPIIFFGLFFVFYGSAEAVGEDGYCKGLPGIGNVLELAGTTYHCEVDGVSQCMQDRAACNAIRGINEDGITNTLIKFSLDKAVAPFVTLLTWLIFNVLGFLLWITGLLMNEAIRITVFDISSYINIGGIKDAWGIIINLLNIGFIFTFVYIGISTILQLGGDYKKLLSRLIMAALLVNFSFFFTGILIDASNILTLTAYKEIQKVQRDTVPESFINDTGEDVEGSELFDPDQLADIDGNISGLFMQYTGIGTLFKTTGFSIEGSLIVAIFGSIFLLILIFAFLFIALLLFVRLAILMILIVTSPIGVIGSSFPGLGKYSSQWWSSLWGQLIFAPIYMIMTLVVALIITSPAFRDLMNVGKGFGETFTEGPADSVGIFVNYLLITTFLIASIAISKSVATMGGGVISDLVGKAGQAAGGALGFAGRNTFGRFGNKLADSQGLKDIQKDESRSRATRFAARQLIFAGDKAAGSSFDARATSIGGDIASKIGGGKATGKGGRKKYVKDQAKKIDERAKLLGELSDEEIKNHPEYKALEVKRAEAIKKKEDDRRKKKAKVKSKKEREKIDSETDAAIKEIKARYKSELDNKERALKIKPQTDYVEKYKLPELSEAGKEISELSKDIRVLTKEIDNLDEGLDKDAKQRELSDLKFLKREAVKRHLASPSGLQDIKRWFKVGSVGAAGAKAVHKRAKQSSKDKLFEEFKKKYEEEEGGSEKGKSRDDSSGDDKKDSS